MNSDPEFRAPDFGHAKVPPCARKKTSLHVPRSEWYQYSQRSQWSSFSRKLGASLWTNGSATNCSSQPLTSRCGSRSCRDSGPQTLHLPKLLNTNVTWLTDDWCVMLRLKESRILEKRFDCESYVPQCFNLAFCILIKSWDSEIQKQQDKWKHLSSKRSFFAFLCFFRLHSIPSTVPILVQPVLSSLMAAARDFETRVALWCCCPGCLDLFDR